MTPIPSNVSALAEEVKRLAGVLEVTCCIAGIYNRAPMGLESDRKALHAAIDRLASLASHSEEQGKDAGRWLPIDSAPTGEYVLLADARRGVSIDDFGLYAQYNQPKFTHWQPLPAAPVATPKEGA